ncbi:MAG: hypothetical protein ACI9TH_005284, partial [Kiritimatiellia bacterium]
TISNGVCELFPHSRFNDEKYSHYTE